MPNETTSSRRLTPEEKAELHALQHKPDRTTEDTARLNYLCKVHNRAALESIDALRHAQVAARLAKPPKYYGPRRRR